MRPERQFVVAKSRRGGLWVFRVIGRNGSSTQRDRPTWPRPWILHFPFRPKSGKPDTFSCSAPRTLSGHFSPVKSGEKPSPSGTKFCARRIEFSSRKHESCFGKPFSRNPARWEYRERGFPIQQKSRSNEFAATAAQSPPSGTASPVGEGRLRAL